MYRPWATRFRDVQIVDENSLAIDCMVNDPTAKAIIEKSEMVREEMADVADSVVSIKIRGVKPDETE